MGLPGPFARTKGKAARDPVWQYDVPEIPEMDNLFAPEVGERHKRRGSLGAGCPPVHVTHLPNLIHACVSCPWASVQGPIKEAEELAGAAFGGTKRTWFLVNGRCVVFLSLPLLFSQAVATGACSTGHSPDHLTCDSTGGVLAALIAAVRRQQQQQQQRSSSPRRPPKVLLPRNVHKSAINGLILAGAEPVFLTPVYDAAMDICHGVPLEGPDGEGEAEAEGTLAAALREHAPGGDVAAVLLVSPTYHGAALDVARAAALCREHGVPLIMDEAHGAHLSFLAPREAGEDPRPLVGALAAGADLVVQSTHKTLAAFSQAAMMHAGRWERGRGREMDHGPSLCRSPTRRTPHLTSHPIPFPPHHQRRTSTTRSWTW